jgi:REP element-mobilizing transposase RayT
MTSPSPLLYDTYYHIYNRGVNRENIFIEERNYDLFLRLYEKHLMPLVDTFAYCMLRNHFHICLRTKSEDEILDFQKTLRVSSVSKIKTLKVSTPDSERVMQDPLAGKGEILQEKPLGFDTISRHFSNFFNAYAKTMNKAYGRTGSLFQHPFGRVAITSDRQFWNVIAYIHQNPQKHGFVKDFRDWKYSSYGVMLSEKKTILNRAETMKWFGTKAEYLSLHSHWVTDVQAGWFAKDDYD